MAVVEVVGGLAVVEMMSVVETIHGCCCLGSKSLKIGGCVEKLATVAEKLCEKSS